MKKLIIISFALLTATVLKGQDSTNFTNSNLFLELGGAGSAYSVNYERLFPINEVVKLTGRAGFSILPSNLGIFEKQRWSPVFPLMFNLVYGRTISLETGLGITIIPGDFFWSEWVNPGLIKWYNGTLGLRYHKPGKGFLVRLGYTPFFNFANICENPMCTEKRLANWIGLSVGTRIKSK